MLQTIIDAVFPPQCASCRAIGSGLCERCVPLGEPLERIVQGLPVVALGAYEGSLRDAILALKDGRRDVARALAQRLTSLVPPACAIVPVPTTFQRRMRRGFDGTIEIARGIDASRTVPVLRIIARDAQRGRSRVERLGARGRFRCDAVLHEQRVVLLDDVCTTGSTLADCADALRAAGAVVAGAVVGAMAGNADY